jgi:hypothetical protein
MSERRSLFRSFQESRCAFGYDSRFKFLDRDLDILVLESFDYALRRIHTRCVHGCAPFCDDRMYRRHNSHHAHQRSNDPQIYSHLLVVFHTTEVEVPARIHQLRDRMYFGRGFSGSRHGLMSPPNSYFANFKDEYIVQASASSAMWRKRSARYEKFGNSHSFTIIRRGRSDSSPFGWYGAYLMLGMSRTVRRRFLRANADG